MLSTRARGLTFPARWVPAIPYRNTSHNRGRVEPSGKLSWMGCGTYYCPRRAIANSQEAVGKMGTARLNEVIIPARRPEKD